MHLPGITDASNIAAVKARLLERLPYRDPAGTPPILRMLFRPPDLGRSKGCVLFRSRGDHAAMIVHDQRSCAPRPYIDAKKKDENSVRPKKAALST